jgi:hypothetical protein
MLWRREHLGHLRFRKVFNWAAFESRRRQLEHFGDLLSFKPVSSSVSCSTATTERFVFSQLLPRFCAKTLLLHARGDATPTA